jgi:hypothetical protein
MPDIEVTGWIPVRKLLRLEPDYPEDFYDCSEQFRMGLCSVLPRLSSTILRVETRASRPDKAITRNLQLLNGGYMFNPRFFEFIEVRCLMRYDKKTIQAPNPGCDISDADLLGFAALELSTVLEDALLLAQLSFPARIKSEKGRTYVHRHAMNHISSVSGGPYESGMRYDLQVASRSYRAV